MGLPVKNGTSKNGYTAVPLQETIEDFPVSLANGKSDERHAHLTFYPSRLKTLLSLVFLLFAMLMNDLALACIHERVPQTEPLPDLWFALFPEYPGAIRVTETIMLVSITLTLLTLLLHQHRWVVLRRVLCISALVYLGRALCISVTQVPVPSRNTYCDPKAANTSLVLVAKRVWWIFSGLGVDIYHNRVLCGDLIYSGHTVTLVICYLAVNEYMPRRFRALVYVSKLIAFVGPVCILAARKHYTLDIIIAYYITTRVFWIYHSLVALKSSGPSVPLNKVFWHKLFNYFEADVHTPFTNNFSPPQFIVTAVSRLSFNR